MRRIIGGFNFVWNERFLLGCITLDLFAVLLGGATALLPVFARDILDVGPEGLGQMRAAPAVGAAAVALWMSWKPLENNVGLKMLLAVAAFIILYIPAFQNKGSVKSWTRRDLNRLAITRS